MELRKTFDAKAAEERWIRRWEASDDFKADPGAGGDKVFSIVIPPPNITGQLHLGHALNVTLQDVIVRTRRMQGYNTLWLPGTDHAGIATQNAVERDLAKSKTDRHQLGREEFLSRVWKWRETYGRRILDQLKRLGASCDFSRERFTLDEGLSRAVTRVFVELYREGRIYRDRRLINWCPRCETALSDLEVDHRDADGKLYYIRYPLVGGSGPDGGAQERSTDSAAITVATTRPETMLADTAVAVHPQDERFAAFLGARVKLPLTDRDIPIIADEAVDKEFGTGAVKITPGHDFNDFELGRRHSLDEISAMDERARMNENAGAYRGLERGECREKILADLKSAGLLEKVEPHRHAVGVCSRCDSVVEPMLSEQWFLRVDELARKAIKAVRDGDTKFHPRFWENTYFNWMENVHDWCISRQLWWGHRIPAWRCARCGEAIVEEERPRQCGKCAGTDLSQDEDVLDTWFSSALWPFSTLGWPEKTADLKRYYPTSLLVTGFDIIFFWVARMMMMGLWFTGDRPGEGKVPFRDVYITPLVRDRYGKKMTKSRGNVVDPLELMDRYGTDALRMTLAQLAVQGRDVILSDERLAASRAFANKVWNAARFVMLNLDGAPQPLPKPDEKTLSLADRWILDKLEESMTQVVGWIDDYAFDAAAMMVYGFIWHQFCDWYIELSKKPLREGGEREAATRWVLVHCFDRMLRMLHPFMPFVSEEIWQVIRPFIDEAGLSEHLVTAHLPTAGETKEYTFRLSAGEQRGMAHCIEAAEATNSLRSLLGVHPGEKVSVLLTAISDQDGAGRERNLKSFEAEVAAWRDYAATMTKAQRIEVLPSDAPEPEGMVTAVLGWCKVSVKAPKGFDFSKARDRLKKKLDEVSLHRDQHLRRLENPGFLKKAAPETQEQVRARAGELEAQHRLIREQLNLLGASD